MKKTVFIIILGLGALVLATPVLASTSISLSPSNINVAPGENFNVVVAVNPYGVGNYTVKAEIEYPADLLKVKSFNFGSGWLALSQSGYDLVDNENGLLIKTAGYPGGLSASATFGVITFSAKKTGGGIITIGSNSLSLDSANKDVFNNVLSYASFNIKAGEAIPVVSSPGEISSEGDEEDEVSVSEGEEVAVTEPGQESEEGFSLPATVGSIMTLGTNSVWVAIPLLVAILVILICLVYFFNQKLRRNN